MYFKTCILSVLQSAYLVFGLSRGPKNGYSHPNLGKDPKKHEKRGKNS
jgi:hypothetical protein